MKLLRFVPAPVVMFAMGLVLLPALVLALVCFLLMAAAGVVLGVSFVGFVLSAVGAVFGAAGALNAACMSAVAFALAFAFVSAFAHYGTLLWRFVFAPPRPAPLGVSLRRDVAFASP